MSAADPARLNGLWPWLRRRCAIPLAAGGLVVLAAGLGGGAWSGGVPSGWPAPSVEAAVREAGAGPEIARVYAERGYRPLWLREGRLSPAGERAVAEMARAGEHGLVADRYLTPELRALLAARSEGGAYRPGDEVDVALSVAFARFADDVRRPAEGNDLLRVDPALTPSGAAAERVLERVGEDGAQGVADALAMHEDYARLAVALRDWRREWRDLPRVAIPAGPEARLGDADQRLPLVRRRLGLPVGGERFDAALAERVEAFQRWHGLEVTGALDRETVRGLNADPDDYERRILVNLDRLRGLPVDLGRRHVRVDAPAAELTAYEDGRPVKRMRVVVGRAEQPTPMMAGRIQYAMLSPYWNMPHDLVRDDVAPAVLAEGAAVFDQRGLEALSDWSPAAATLEPEAVDWTAVASGATRLRVRQKPGPANMMGEVKFMLPNRLGIYLHDTPDRSLFARDRRALSAGCVRVEDARWLGRWLLGEEIGGLRTGVAEQRVDLAEPVPVYILYRTVVPRAGGGLMLLPDIYGRDGISSAA